MLLKISPFRLFEPRPTPNDGPTDGNAGLTWGVSATGAASSPFTGAGIKVAVLDTGIDESHPAFQGASIATRDFTGADDAHDYNGHGTHCTATLLGRNVDGERIGVAPGVRVVFCGKVLGNDGRGGTESLIRGLTWAEEQGANLISMSLGIEFSALLERLTKSGCPLPAALSMALEAYRANIELFSAISDWFAARELTGRGALVVCAGGNESDRRGPMPYEVSCSPPAALERHLSVGALDRCGRSGFSVAEFSNSGVNVVAPGVRIRSAKAGGGLVSLSGTSMAAPHACGVAALWGEKLLDEAGRVRPSELRAVVLGRSQFIDGANPNHVGRGLVQAPQSDEPRRSLLTPST